jgi:hypothetical protein
VGFDACSPAREDGAGTLRHPGTWTEDGVAGRFSVRLVWVVSDLDATVEVAV